MTVGGWWSWQGATFSEGDSSNSFRIDMTVGQLENPISAWGSALPSGFSTDIWSLDFQILLWADCFQEKFSSRSFHLAMTLLVLLDFTRGSLFYCKVYKASEDVMSNDLSCSFACGIKFGGSWGRIVNTLPAPPGANIGYDPLRD